MAVNENRKGYKKTKLGWIPEDWETKKIDSLFTRIRKSVKVEPDEIYEEIGIRSHGKGLFHKEPVTGEKIGNKSVFWIETNCLVLNIVFAWEQAVAKTTDLEKGKIASHRFPMYKAKPQITDLDYVLYFFKSPIGKHSLGLASPGGAGRNKTLGQGEFSKLKIPYPPYPEQKKIAEILGISDKAIELTQELIQAKTRRKKGLMQQLLTGKKRFGEFADRKGCKNTKIGKIPGKWGLQHLEKCAEVLFSNVDKKMDEKENPVLLCNYTDVYYNDYISEKLDFMKATAKAAEIKKYSLKKGDVIITKDSETPDDIAVPAFVSEKLDNVLCGYHLALIRPDRKILLGEYLSKLFQLQTYRYYFFTLANGVTRFGLTTQATLQSLIPLPSITEQRKIATVLTTCDKEIDLLSQKLEALKQQKKGLMQKLLTGQIRPSTSSGHDKND